MKLNTYPFNSTFDSPGANFSRDFPDIDPALPAYKNIIDAAPLSALYYYPFNRAFTVSDYYTYNVNITFPNDSFCVYYLNSGRFSVGIRSLCGAFNGTTCASSWMNTAFSSQTDMSGSSTSLDKTNNVWSFSLKPSVSRGGGCGCSYNSQGTETGVMVRVDSPRGLCPYTISMQARRACLNGYWETARQTCVCNNGWGGEDCSVPCPGSTVNGLGGPTCLETAFVLNNTDSVSTRIPAFGNVWVTHTPSRPTGNPNLFNIKVAAESGENCGGVFTIQTKEVCSYYKCNTASPASIDNPWPQTYYSTSVTGSLSNVLYAVRPPLVSGITCKSRQAYKEAKGNIEQQLRIIPLFFLIFCFVNLPFSRMYMCDWLTDWSIVLLVWSVLVYYFHVVLDLQRINLPTTVVVTAATPAIVVIT